VIAATQDRFLGGRIVLSQPQNGFRAGLDAVMLAAAVPAGEGEDVLELGAGAGTASLCLAARVPDGAIVGVEIDQTLAALANDNAKENRFETRLRFAQADVFDLPPTLKRDFAHVFCNPPFHYDAGAASPDAARDRALRDKGLLGDWMEVGLKRTASGGTFTTIIRADRLGEVLARLPEQGTLIFPLWPRVGSQAKRVIVQACKGSRAQAAILPGLVLHETDGRYTPQADAVLRGEGLKVVRTLDAL
jgi:tRNA1(Val) A37 N6-methylase TrmN6